MFYKNEERTIYIRKKAKALKVCLIINQYTYIN